MGKDQLTLDGVRITAFAMKLPNVKPSGDTALDHQREEGRKNLMKMISLLQENENLVASQLANLKGAIENAKKPTDNVTLGLFHESYTQVHRWPKYFLAIVLVSAAGIPKEVVDKIDTKDPDFGIRGSFQCLTALEPNDHVPKDLRSKAETEHVLCIRIQSIGHVAKFKTGIAPDGTVNWPAVGCYKPLWDKTPPMIEHIPTGDKRNMLKSLNFTKEWKFENSWNNFKARAYHPSGGDCFLHECFKADMSGPYKHKIKPGMVSLKTIYDDWQRGGGIIPPKAEAQLISSGTETDILPTVYKQRAERAKELAKQRCAGKRKREIDIDE